jgi:hypothetical protein
MKIKNLNSNNMLYLVAPKVELYKKENKNLSKILIFLKII